MDRNLKNLRTKYSAEYRTWAAMRTRCKNQNDARFPRYGGRGISVCDRWRKFENFIADMGPRPEGLTLDRINNDGNYEPGNCRWATMREQCQNRSNGITITVYGESLLLVEAARKHRIPYHTMLYWVQQGKGGAPLEARILYYQSRRGSSAA